MNEFSLSQNTWLRHKIVNFLVTILFISNFFFALFPAWRLSPLWRFISIDEYFSVWLDIVSKLSLLLSVLIIMFEKTLKSLGLVIWIFLSFLFCFISIIINQTPPSLITCFAFPFEYIVLLVVCKNYRLSICIQNVTLTILAIWAILPIFLMFLGPSEYRMAMMLGVNDKIESFGGFAFHRNFYGFYTGLTILLFAINPVNKFLKGIIISICSVGIIISASRSALICTVLSLLVYYYNTNKKILIKWLPLAVIIVLVTGYVYSYYGIRDKGIGDNEDRYEILNGFVDFISQSPIFGHGKSMVYYSLHYPAGAAAHNVIVQVWADYGILTLISFIAIFAITYFKGNANLRTLLSFLILVGLMQPYFYLCMPQPFLIIVMILGYSMSNYNNRYSNERYCYNRT